MTKVPWDFSFLSGGEPLEEKEKKLNNKEQEIADRRKAFEDGDKEARELEEEFDEWNSAYG